MFMATITSNKLLLLLCLFALLPLAMDMMPLPAQSAGTICGAVIALVYMVCENYFLLPFYCKMSVFKNGQKIRHMMQFGFIIKLVCCLGWLCGLAFGQAELSDALTGSVTFPALGITCLGNLAVFYRCILRGPPKLDIGAKDVLTTVTARKLEDLNQGEGLTTCPLRVDLCDVVMLSMQMPPNSSTQRFMEYMSNVHNINSVCLPFRRLERVPITEQICTCMERISSPVIECGCVVFDTLEEITMVLAHWMPGTLRRLSASQCLLPDEDCLRNGCHGCDHMALLHPFGVPHLESPAAVCSLLTFLPCTGIICIPVHPARDDKWTRQLITLLELKGKRVRRRNSASSALKNYIAGSGESEEETAHHLPSKTTSQRPLTEVYNIVSLVIMPTLTEVLINIALTFWFKADGFSSAVVARRAMEDYLPGHSGGGNSPIAFLTSVVVKSNQNNTSVCQLLTFRGSRLIRPLYFMMGFVNLICSVSWIVLVALEGGANKWYHTHSMPLSKARVIVIIIAIGISLGMSLSHWLLYESDSRSRSPNRNARRYILLRFIMFCMIVLDILCIVSGSIVLGTVGMKVFGRWLYGALQCLVWIKWAIANYLTTQFSRSEVPYIGDYFGDYIDGRYLYASPFFLNAILAGVRAKWEFS